MNRSMMKKIISSVITLALFSTLCISAYADDNYIVDSVGVLSSDELDELEEMAEESAQKYGITTAVLFVDSFEGMNPASYTDAYWNSSSYGDDCSIMAIAVDDRDYYLYNCGQASKAVTDYGSNYVDNQILPYLKNSDWYGAAKEYINANETLYKEYINTGKAYDVNNHPVSVGTTILQVVICLGLGFLLSLLILNGKRKEMNSVVSEKNADNYTSSDKFKLTNQKDQFFDKKVIVTPLPRNNSGNGGTSMHSGSGGHSFSGHGGKF